MNHKITYVLYGVADRDLELVSMFFASRREMRTFVDDLPGRYRTMRLYGVIPDEFTVFGDEPVTAARCGDGSDIGEPIEIGPGFDLPDGRHQSRRRPIAEIRTDVEKSMRAVWEKQDEIVDLNAEVRDLCDRADKLIATVQVKRQTLAHLQSQSQRYQVELETAIAEDHAEDDRYRKSVAEADELSEIAEGAK